MAKAIAYKDLDLTMSAHPITGDLISKTNDEAVKQAVKNLVLTGVYQRAMQPEIGCQVYGLLFELDSPFVRIAIANTIRETLNTHEHRISVNGISVAYDNEHGFNVNINYTIKDYQLISSVSVFLSRVR